MTEFQNNIETILQKDDLKLGNDYLEIKKFQDELSLKYQNTNPENVVKSQIIDEFLIIKFKIEIINI